MEEVGVDVEGRAPGAMEDVDGGRDDSPRKAAKLVRDHSAKLVRDHPRTLRGLTSGRVAVRRSASRRCVVMGKSFSSWLLF